MPKPVILLLASLLLCAPAVQGEQKPTGAFDAQAAWREFYSTLTLFYAYLEREDFDTKAYLLRVEKQALQTTSEVAFRQLIHRATYAFTDPHFIVGPFSEDDFNIIPTSADLQIEIEQDQFVVRDVRKGSAADIAGVRTGWQVVSVNGQRVGDAVEGVMGDLLPAPTVRQKNYLATLIANGRRAHSREIVFATVGEKVTVTLPSPRDFAVEVAQGPLLNIRKVQGIGVIEINNSLGNNGLIYEFDQAMSRTTGLKGLILDLRNTPSGGNTEVARSIIGHFLTKTASYQVHEIPSLEREFSVPRRFIEQVKPRPPHFSPDKVVVLGGHWTGSMGEGLLIGLNGAAGIKTIASDMGKLLGGLSNFNLRGGNIRLDIGTEVLFHVDGTRRENYVADVVLTAADRDALGEDPGLAAAISWLLAKQGGELGGTPQQEIR